MKTAVIIQARLGSLRLPSKVLKKINGKTLIEIIYSRLSKAKLVDQIIFSIPNTKENNELEIFLKKKKISYFRGDEKDVLSRYYNTAKELKVDNIVRITGDCPLVDYKIVDEFIKIFLKEKKDYVSNCNPWTYPDGLDVEVFNFKLLSYAQKNAKKYHRLNDGVLISFLKENKNFDILNIKCPIKYASKYRLTVDEEVDFILIKKIYDKFHPNIFFGFNDIIKMLRKNKKLFTINSKIKQNTGSLMNKSQKIWTRANSIILGGNSLLSKNPEMFLPNKWPTYFSKAKGIKVWDLDKKLYYDMSLMGVGTNILGYANKEVDEAVKKNILNGNMSTLNSYEEVLLAEKLIDMHPWANKVKFARTGGEANSLAIRIARAATGKDNVAFCGYHGWHDWYLSANLKKKGSLDSHLLPGLDPFGVPKKLKNTSFGFKYGDTNGLKKIVNNQKIGIIKMEVQRNTMPNIKFLKQVRELATKKNIVLIFDECTSGFRQSFGGLHKSINVIPDMAIFGKALGNGYAITAVLGKNEVMEKAKRSFMSSTFWTERIGPTAALKTLEIMERDSSWLRITNLGNKLISIWKKISKRHKVKIEINGLPALAKFSFLGQKSQEYKTYLTQEMLDKGFLAANGVYMSTAHNEKILRRYENLLDEIFFMISKCQKGNEEIEKILLSPVSRMPFSRLN
jgi:glutamate-1-semialdehyde 2,1-aminomutase